MDEAVGKLLPIGSLVVCCVVMAVCMARGRHRGTASYRRWRQRYTLEPHGVERLTLELRGVDQLSLEPHGVERLTLEPHGVEQLVWMCFNVSLMIVCLTVPLNVYQLLKDAGAIVPATIDDIELDELIETVGLQAEYCCFSLKIVVYLASSSRFRQELRSVFHVRAAAAAAK